MLPVKEASVTSSETGSPKAKGGSSTAPSTAPTPRGHYTSSTWEATPSSTPRVDPLAAPDYKSGLNIATGFNPEELWLPVKEASVTSSETGSPKAKGGSSSAPSTPPTPRGHYTSTWEATPSSTPRVDPLATPEYKTMQNIATGFNPEELWLPVKEASVTSSETGSPKAKGGSSSAPSTPPTPRGHYTSTWEATPSSTPRVDPLAAPEYKMMQNIATGFNPEELWLPVKEASVTSSETGSPKAKGGSSSAPSTPPTPRGHYISSTPEVTPPSTPQVELSSALEEEPLSAPEAEV